MKERLKKLFSLIKTHPIIVCAILAPILGCIPMIYLLIKDGTFEIMDILAIFNGTLLIGGLLVLPGLLTLYNLFYLLIPGLSDRERKNGQNIEIATILLGITYSLVYAFVPEIQWDKNWSVQLYNSELHAPIATWTWPTLGTVFAVAIVGYLILRIWKIHHLPPLVATLSIGAVYLGVALCITWCIQLCKHDLLLCLFPFNLVVIFAKAIKEVICDWHRLAHEPPVEKARLILFFHNLLYKAQHWTWIGFLLAVPLLGILIAVLTLFGQAPDSIIQAWTQTSDWTLSQQVAPQNIYMDMHYLCTVAAGGHKKVVKPLRIGKRHGHRVLVNRQLCVANAFEQLLEERIPRVHRVIRNFYDKYGYPIAKHIRSPYTADLVWFLMKPLEWFFLIVLYLFDRKPENRIAVQYPHAPIPKE